MWGRLLTLYFHYYANREEPTAGREKPGGGREMQATNKQGSG